MTILFALLALVWVTTAQAATPSGRVLVSRECPPQPGGTWRDGTGCHGGYDVRAEDVPRLQELTLEREKQCDAKAGSWACDWAGQRYEKGEGVSQDPRRAAQLYARDCGASLDQPYGSGCDLLAALARRYEAGDGLPRDGDEAASLYKASCPAIRGSNLGWLGSKPGCLALARAYVRGEIVPRDLAAAVGIYSGACGQPGYTSEGCAGLVLVDSEGGAEYTKALKDPPAWLDVASLTNLCGEGARDPVACRALAWRYQRGSRVPVDTARARLLLERACDRGDAESCLELRGTCEPAAGTAATLETACILGDGAACRDVTRMLLDGCIAVSSAEALRRVCALGDAQGCWHRDLRVCRGDLPFVGGVDALGAGSPATPWTECVTARGLCDAGDAKACINLAFAIRDTYQGPGAHPNEAAAEALEKGLLLYEAACQSGDPAACHASADLDGKNYGFVAVAHRADAKATRERGLALEDAACRAGDTETCLKLGDRYHAVSAFQSPTDVEHDDHKARRYYQRAAALDRSACEASDLLACRRLETTYSWKLDDEGRAASVWRHPCREGSKEACEALASWNDRGGFGVTALFRVGYDHLQGWGGAGGLILGERYVDSGSSHSTIAFPYQGGRGWLLEAGAGQRAVKASIGRGIAGSIVPGIIVGRDLKLSVLRTWDGSSAGATYVGVEADLALIANLSVGVFRRLGDHPTTQFNWGVSFGF